MGVWQMIVLEVARYFALVVGLLALVASLKISGTYAKIALSHGPRAMWRDLRSLKLPRLLPVHVAVISFCMAGYLAGVCIEIVVRFGEPLSWRLLYLPLNVFTGIAIGIVTIFVQNRGPRVVPDEDRGLLDRTDSQETLKHLEEQRLRTQGADLRQQNQDQRDVHQDERGSEQDERTLTQDTRDRDQQAREQSQNERKGVQDVREVSQNQIEQVDRDGRDI